MRLLRTILLAAFLVSLTPLGAFCHDEHADATTRDGHCVTMCSFVCFNATIPDQKSMSMLMTPVTPMTFVFINSAYQNPSLDALRRPPAFSA